MIQDFERIAKERNWSNTRIETMLHNIEGRLKRRLPENAELTLTKFQKRVIDDQTFWRDWEDNKINHLMIQGATSAGKTLVSELAILDTLRHDQKPIVLVPLKAMVRERTAHFKEDMGHGIVEFDTNVFGSSGDYMEDDERIIHGVYSVAVIVYEKFFAMLSQGNSGVMENCGLLVVDELSILNSEQRGPKLEMALEIVRGKYPQTRIMCLATCDCSTENICRWLDIRNPIISSARPVALEEHILELNGSGWYRMIPADTDSIQEGYCPERIEEKIEVPNYQSDWRRSDKERKLLLSVISKIYQKTDDARLLVFVSTQSKASEIASYLKDNITSWYPFQNDVRIALDEEFIEMLSTCDRDEGQAKLIDELIPYGIAYHHAGISTTLRELIEEQFSKQKSNLRVIVATETLTVGVNMPFDAMIMLSNKVPRGQGEMMPLNLQEYRNYIGRAGRLGQSNRIGTTYLFVERRTDLERYWESFNNREEVTSALTDADAAVLAPYYLSLLHNRSGTTSRNSTMYLLDDIKKLYESSLLRRFRSADIREDEIQDKLDDAYLSCRTSKSGPQGRRSSTDVTYGIEDFGTRIAPFAFSTDTCLWIYWYFFAGYQNGGFPADLTKEDIESDRFLLDILYHVCRHKEIAESSNVMYPLGDQNMGKLHRAKFSVLDQLHSILDEEDDTGEKRYQLWYEVNDSRGEECSDIWLLLNRTNLSDERVMLQAAMRAIVLFYWTQGLTVYQIRSKTGFHNFTKLIAGDIERLAEVASFHLNAIYRCMETAKQAGNTRPVCSGDTLKGLYELHTRVKYGMSRDLVKLANKHVHGLDRKRLLNLKNAADKCGMTPIQYLYLTHPDKLVENTLTASQQMQLISAIERRNNVGSIEVIMQIIENDLGSDVSSQEIDTLRALASWGESENEKRPDEEALDLMYKALKSISGIKALNDITIYSDGHASKIIWMSGGCELHIGVLYSDTASSRITEFFEGAASAKILIVPSYFSYDQMCDAKKRYRADALLDNVFFTFVLAKAINTPLDRGTALTEMLADLRGVFTRTEHSHFPLVRYIEARHAEAPRFLAIFGSRLEKRFENILYDEQPELVLRTAAELPDFEELPWSRRLIDEKNRNRYAEYPIVLLLSREDIVHSENLTEFLFVLRQQRFRNCLLLLESKEAENEWNRAVDEAGIGGNQWSSQFSGISKMIVKSKTDLIQTVNGFVSDWKRASYLIGVSYAHYDTVSSQDQSGLRNDIDNLDALVNKLAEEYGKDRILYDRYVPDLFDGNLGQKKSLDAYKTCRFYLVLWNFWTKENKNCQNELSVILDRCKDDTNKCIFLQPGHPNDPDAPNGYFLSDISQGTINSVFERIKREIESLL